MNSLVQEIVAGVNANPDLLTTRRYLMPRPEVKVPALFLFGGSVSLASVRIETANVEDLVGAIKQWIEARGYGFDPRTIVGLDTSRTRRGEWYIAIARQPG